MRPNLDEESCTCVGQDPHRSQWARRIGWAVLEKDSLALHGTFDLSNRAELTSAVDAFVTSCISDDHPRPSGPPPPAVLDASHLQFIDAGAVGLLAHASSRLRQAHRRLLTRGAPAGLARISAVCGLDSALGLTPDHRAASSDGVGRIVASPEPSLVLASVAENCVPALCDHVSFTLDGRALPPAEEGAIGHSETVTVPFTMLSPIGEPVRGFMRFTWMLRTPTALDRLTAAIMVEHAARTVAWQQSLTAEREATATTENLQFALKTNRRIGAAIGMLMITHSVDEDSAFELLRRASQRANRKLRDVADDVVWTGCLPSAPAVRGTNESVGTFLQASPGRSSPRAAGHIR